jgi:hypothetical protein
MTITGTALFVKLTTGAQGIEALCRQLSSARDRHSPIASCRQCHDRHLRTVGSSARPTTATTAIRLLAACDRHQVSAPVYATNYVISACKRQARATTC